MKGKQGNLDAINVLKGLAYSQLLLQDERAAMLNAGTFNAHQVFLQMDRKTLGKIYPADLVNYLSVHRIAATERECQYLIALAANNQPFLTEEEFQAYIANGRPEMLAYIRNNIGSSGHYGNDETIKNYSEREFAKILEKEIEYYRAIELLKEDYIKKYGFNVKTIVSQIDMERKGHVTPNDLVHYIQSHQVEFSFEEYEALCHKIKARNREAITYKELLKAFSPFEPLNFPTYRKQSNIQKAMQYIGEEVDRLQIDTQIIPFEEDLNMKKASTGFQRVMDDYRQGNGEKNLPNQYFYDKNYYNELKQYKSSFYDPNKDIKKKPQTDIIGPQYHDHFFSDYYLYLQERNRTEHYYNKFGKKYSFENPAKRSMESK